MHPVPEDIEIRDKENKLYLREPYIPAPNTREPKKGMSFSAKFLRYIGSQLDRIFLKEDMTLNFNGVSNHIIRKYFNDLQVYFSADIKIVDGKEVPVRDIICDRLISVLKKHKNDRVMLIAHSMGSIIAYDVMINNPQFKINTVITIGSPLGLPIITSRLYAEQKVKGDLAMPENVISKWYNLSDPRDYVALDHTLADDFKANSRGVYAEDLTVYNDYHSGVEANPHKAFGYLRCYETAHIINDFLEKDYNYFVHKYNKIRRKISGLFTRKKQPGVFN
jgi:hypothetical protein